MLTKVTKLFTVSEVSNILKVNADMVYALIHAGLLPALKLGNLKIREEALQNFLATYEGYDLTDPNNVVKLDLMTN